MTPCSLLDDDKTTNNILLDLSVKANEEEKEDIHEEENVQEDVKENLYKEEEKEDIHEEENAQEDVKENLYKEEEKEDIHEEVQEKSYKEQEEVKEKSILNSLKNIVKLFTKYINEVMKAGAEPLYNDTLCNDDKL